MSNEDEEKNPDSWLLVVKNEDIKPDQVDIMIFDSALENPFIEKPQKSKPNSSRFF